MSKTEESRLPWFAERSPESCHMTEVPTHWDVNWPREYNSSSFVVSYPWYSSCPLQHALAKTDVCDNMEPRVSSPNMNWYHQGTSCNVVDKIFACHHCSEKVLGSDLVSECSLFAGLARRGFSLENPVSFFNSTMRNHLNYHLTKPTG